MIHCLSRACPAVSLEFLEWPPQSRAANGPSLLSLQGAFPIFPPCMNSRVASECCEVHNNIKGSNMVKPCQTPLCMYCLYIDFLTFCTVLLYLLTHVDMIYTFVGDKLSQSISLKKQSSTGRMAPQRMPSPASPNPCESSTSIACIAAPQRST